MRLERGVLISGLDPEAARNLARLVHWQPVPLDYVAAKLEAPEADVIGWLGQLEADGFLERKQGWGWDYATNSRVDQDEWTTTVRGGALAGASFLKPIPRAKAQALLDALLERARAYNADLDKPLWIDQVTVFGSFLDPDATHLGDLDVQYATSPRSDDPRAQDDYTRRSGRRFSSFMDKLFWPQQEVSLLLKNRSGYIGLTTEDISRFTDRSEVVYRRNVEDGADIPGA